MLLLKMITFCKNAKCPSSENLLDFINGELSTNEVEKTRNHLTQCEFCSAEITLYEHYPQNKHIDEEISVEGIPAALYQLADALLSNRQKDLQMLNKLIGKNKNMSLNRI